MTFSIRLRSTAVQSSWVVGKDRSRQSRNRRPATASLGQKKLPLGAADLGPAGDSVVRFVVDRRSRTNSAVIRGFRRRLTGRKSGDALKSNVAAHSRGHCRDPGPSEYQRDSFVISVLIGSLLLLAPAEAAKDQPPLAAQVERLVRGLDSSRLNERDAAERQLLDLGA
jgi:hypothetical protein